MLLAVAYMAAIVALSSVPDDGTGTGVTALLPPPALQNLLHVPLFGGLCWVWQTALRARGLAPRRAVLWAAAIAVAFGALDEFHQTFVTGRSGTATDALLDAAGAAIVVAWVWTRTRRAV
jgi:VanZ family protein